MSWTTRTWQPTVRRDGPFVVVGAYFLIPSLFFIAAWYVDFLAGRSSSLLLTAAAVLAAVLPALICFQMAGRAGRRRFLWTVLVLAGSLMGLWLPARYLILGGPLPPAVFLAVPMTFRQTLAAALVSLLPLLGGTIPVLIYGLAIGVDRPLPGVAPRGAVLLATVAGVIIWFASLFIGLLNPQPPPLAPVEEQITLTAELSPPPTLPGDAVPSTWLTLLWRLQDGHPPGATEVHPENDSVRLSLSADVREHGLLEMLMGRGAIELVDVGDSPPAAGTTVSTTEWPLAGADEAYDTVVSSDDLLVQAHWSGFSQRMVDLDYDDGSPVLIASFEERSADGLQRLLDQRSDAFLSLVLDNVVILSFPLQGALEGNALNIRRLPPEIAPALAAIMRYGPLPLVPAIETGDSPGTSAEQSYRQRGQKGWQFASFP